MFSSIINKKKTITDIFILDMYLGYIYKRYFYFEKKKTIKRSFIDSLFVIFQKKKKKESMRRNKNKTKKGGKNTM